MAIPNHIFDQLNSQADLVSIIGRHTTLKKAGSEYKGCCPFHGEKTPSFYVNPQKNMYHCFGCGVGGNALKFLQDYENLTFMESVKELSRQTGIEIPEEDTHKVSYRRNVKTNNTPNHSLSGQQSTILTNTRNTRPSPPPTPSLNSHSYSGEQPPPYTSAEWLQEFDSAPFYSGDNHSSDNHGDDYVESSYADFTVMNGFEPDDYQAVQSTTIQPTVIQSTAIQPIVQPSFASSTAPHQSGQNLQNLASSQNSPDNEGNLYTLLEQIQHFYQQCLYRNQQAQAYFSSRGLSADTIATFGLGYAPSGWQHLEAQFPNDIEGLKLLGLVRTSEKGRAYNLLRDRVIFTIRDNQGRVIGFAGRALDNEVKPKYINSSDSPVFHKQHVLYGYYESRQHRANDWLVVEGYMDVIALYQAGIYGAVASMGTATNEQQIARLLNLNPVLTLSFDGDSAGQKAAWRTLEVSLPVLTDDKELRFLTLPDNHDPDTYINAHGTDAMREQIANATPLSEYIYQYLSNQHDLTRPEGKAKLMSSLRNLTNQLPKGSTFRSLLNNDIYQKLSGRQASSKNAQNLLIDFRTQFTSSINLCLCLLYQPELLANNPLDHIYQLSGIKTLRYPNSIDKKIANGSLTLPSLPNWQDFHNPQIRALVQTIQPLLSHLPKDANTASHFILASLSPSLQQELSPYWQAFYQGMRQREVVDIEHFFIELLTHELLKIFSQQQQQNKNLFVRDILMRRRQQLVKWENSKRRS